MTDLYWHFTFVQTDDMDANEDAEKEKSTRFVILRFSTSPGGLRFVFFGLLVTRTLCVGVAFGFACRNWRMN